MTCSVSRCGREAVVEVTFVHSTSPLPYCQGHYYCPWRHRPWWDDKHIRTIQRLDVATKTTVR